MEDSNSLDLTDSAEDRVHVPVAFTRDHADWLTADGQANFARGTEASVTQSQADAYAAMVMHDTLCSPLGLDSARPTLVLSDVRAQPSKKDDGYATLEAEGDLPDTTAIIQTLMLHRDFIMSNQMIYLIVDNRMPTDVPHWPAFAAWWASRRCLVGPQEEATDILWVCADATTGLHKIPYYWAGVFVLEAARFLYPAQHFALGLPRVDAKLADEPGDIPPDLLWNEGRLTVVVWYALSVRLAVSCGSSIGTAAIALGPFPSP